MMNYNISTSGEGEVAKSLVKSIGDILLGARKNNLTAEVMQKIITRALAKTGGRMRAAIKKGMQSELPLADRAVNHAGINIAETLMKNRPHGARRAKGQKPKLVMGGQTRPARRLAGAMRYAFNDNKEQEMAVGLLDPSTTKSGAQETLKASQARAWRKRFADFQEEGDVDISGYQNASERSMFAYFRALGIPLTRHPRRPARPVIEPIEARENPQKLFETNFLERLNK